MNEKPTSLIKIHGNLTKYTVIHAHQAVGHRQQALIRLWSQVRDVHNYPSMYTVPNVQDDVCNCHHAWRSSKTSQCTGMGISLQSQQAPLKKLDMNGWTHSSFLWLCFTCNSLTSAHTRSSVISSLLRLQSIRTWERWFMIFIVITPMDTIAQVSICMEEEFDWFNCPCASSTPNLNA